MTTSKIKAWREKMSRLIYHLAPAGIAVFLTLIVPIGLNVACVLAFGLSPSAALGVLLAYTAILAIWVLS